MVNIARRHVPQVSCVRFWCHVQHIRVSCFTWCGSSSFSGLIHMSLSLGHLDVCATNLRNNGRTKRACLLLGLNRFVWFSRETFWGRPLNKDACRVAFFTPPLLYGCLMGGSSFWRGTCSPVSLFFCQQPTESSSKPFWVGPCLIFTRKPTGELLRVRCPTPSAKARYQNL